MAIKEQLIEKLSQTESMPFLFIGSGISLRYLGAETFINLLTRFCHKLPYPFAYYYSSANKSCPRTASQMVSDFHALWFKEPEFSGSHGKYMDTIGSKDAPLKIEISKYMLDDISLRAPNVSMQNEIELLRKVQVDGIITTNWDCFLDKLFPEFECFIGQERLLFSTPQSIAEIYKIHGCCTNPDSLVLTEEDYIAFEKKNAYLAAKLLTVFVEHPIVFLGYSIDDEDIKKILESIAACLSKTRLQELSGRLFFVQWEKGITEGIIEKDTLNKSLPLTIIKTDSFAPIYEALSERKRTIPAKSLRKFKEQIYQLVKTNNAKIAQMVRDFDNIDIHKRNEMYVGVGPTVLPVKGYTPIMIHDVLEDFIFDKGRYEADMLLSQTLPSFLKNSKYVPVFKYVHIFTKNANFKEDMLPDIILKHIRDMNQNEYQTKNTSNERKNKIIEMKINEIQSQYPNAWTTLIPFLPVDEVDIDELEQVLRNEFQSQMKQKNITNFKRLIGYYDWLRFGRLYKKANTQS